MVAPEITKTWGNFSGGGMDSLSRKHHHGLDWPPAKTNGCNMS